MAVDPAQRLGQLGRQLFAGEPTGEDVGASLPLDDAAFRQLLHAAERERVTGMLAYAVAQHALVLTDEQLADLARAHAAAMAVALVLERLLCAVHAVLADASIDHVVLKGPAVAHTVYPDPSVRDFGDIDLLIPGSELERCVRVLVDTGATRSLAELAPGWDERFGKSITLTDRSGYEIDLHRTIAPGVFGLRVDPAVLFARTQPFTVGGHHLRALAPAAQLLQACLHTAAGNRRVWLSSINDIVLLTRGDTVEAEEFRSLAENWQAGAAVERAVLLVRERCDGVDVSSLLEGLPVSDADRRRLDHYGDGFSGPALTGFGALPLTRWPAYARALAWPSAANLRDRNLTRRAHVLRLVRRGPHSSAPSAQRGGSST